MIYVALLRGINVRGQNRLAMSDLKPMIAGLGFGSVQTYVQSGNVLFDAPGQDEAALARRIQSRIEEAFGLEVAVVLRTAAALRRVLDNNPFLTARQADPVFLHVTFLAAPAGTAQVQALSIPNAGLDEYILSGREVYLFCPGGYGRTKLTNTVFEKKLGVPATTRNWKTVNALVRRINSGDA